MNSINYQKQMDLIIQNNLKTANVPKLLLHSCCAPCSSYVIEYLSDFFEITILYYNPNISFEDEYKHRLQEQIKLVSEIKTKYAVTIKDAVYNPKDFLKLCKGLENEKEGGQRCKNCFEMRLNYSAEYAKQNDYDFFATTLTISPLKNAQIINEIGILTGERYGIKYLCSDFKKKNGYKRSIELSKQYNLYRQNYCGCIFSKKQQETDLQL